MRALWFNPTVLVEDWSSISVPVCTRLRYRRPYKDGYVIALPFEDARARVSRIGGISTT